MTTSPGSFQKQPSEQYNITFSFSKQLSSSGAEISSKEVIASLNGTDVTSDIIQGSAISSDGLSVIVGVKGGIDRNNYVITVKVTSNQSLDGSGTEKCKYEAETTMIVLNT